MRGLAGLRKKGGCGDVVILLEHEPVITLGRRGGPADLLFPENVLRSQGVSVERVERGGLATCHGPGQLVLYPVVDMKELGLGIADFTRALEQTAIDALSELGIEAGRHQGHPGVWVGPEKIASLGLAVSRGVTTHGLSLNNNVDLGLFSLINPCGLSAGCITSIEKLLGGGADSERLRDLIKKHLGRILNLQFEAWDLAQAWELISREKNHAA